ncbi:MAG: bile acid:sodium symporter family protein [Oleiphilaceae bacterium]|nr:bile acid:sodium symporter family protein [Oleiphilaceae bacterium]
MDVAQAIDFNPASLITLNIIMAGMMFAVSLNLKPEDFSRVLKAPVAPLAGLAAQFLLLPATTCLFTWWLRVDPELALGMILVASCPGGSFSNIMTWLGKANVAVSVSMTAVSSLVATVLTPLNFALYGYLNPHTRELLTRIDLPATSLLGLVVLVLGVPLVAGMLTGHRFPGFARRSERPFRVVALMVFLGFVVIAFSRNSELFVERFHTFFWLVVAHNLLALGLGYLMGRLARLPLADRRAVIMEVGIQNSGLGLVIIFTFFPQAGGMMLITAFWGVWHLVAGLSLALLWSRTPQPPPLQEITGKPL